MDHGSTLVDPRLIRMLVVDLARDVVRKVIVLRRVARLPVVPRALGINRIHAAQFLDPLAQGVFFCHRSYFTASAAVQVYSRATD